jgi:hypothetical protein
VKDARVKDARDKANASAHQASPAAISVEPDDHQQSQLAPLPQPSDQGSDDPFSPATVSQSSEATPEAQSSALEGMAAAQNHDSTVEPLDAKQHFEYELFHSCVLDYLSDGVIFVDHNQRVKVWSQGAEKATGITPSAVLNRQLLPQTIRLCDTNGNHLQLDKCPVARSLRTLQIVSGEFKIANSSTQGGMKVELTSIPVIDKNRYVSGAVVMFHDRTAQVNLQRQLKDLYEFSVLDPLTQVANRAEFERVQQEYVLAFQQSDDFNCSIIICDIDFFKSINDNFGHTVGDEALMAFAEMLKRYVRPQDLVARYGGEEFVLLCGVSQAPFC